MIKYLFGITKSAINVRKVVFGHVFVVDHIWLTGSSLLPENISFFMAIVRLSHNKSFGGSFEDIKKGLLQIPQR